jgi:hypothetical protein
VDRLAGATGADVETADFLEATQFQARLFDRLAPRNHLGGLFAVDDPGDDLHQPGPADPRQGADAKLFDQHHDIGPRVVGQHGHGVTAFEQFARQRRTHAAAKQRVTQAVALETKDAVVADLARLDVDALRHVGLDVTRAQSWSSSSATVRTMRRSASRISLFLSG